MNPIEFTSVWNTEYAVPAWDVFLDGELCYTGIPTSELSEFAEALLASNLLKTTLNC
jgi:hypothetical protein